MNSDRANNSRVIIWQGCADMRKKNAVLPFMTLECLLYTYDGVSVRRHVGWQ